MKRKIALLFLMLVTFISVFALSACDKDDRDDDEEKHKHKLGEWVEEVSASCTENGVLGHYQCTKCGMYLNENKKEIPDIVIPAAHSFGAWVEEIPAKCIEDGVKGYYPCSVCGKNFDANYAELSTLVIDKAGAHDYVNEVCTKCGSKIVYSEGLEYELVNNTYYKIVGIGTCEDSELYIPKTYNNLPVKEIASGSFSCCDTFTRVIIGENVVGIGEYAFGSCNNLLSVVIPASVESFSYNAFEGCYALVEVINKSSLKLMEYAFRNVIEVHKGPSKLVNKDGYLFYSKGSFKVSNYLIGYVGNESNLILPESYNGKSYEINDYAFAYRNDVKSVTIGNNVTSICDYAFSSCPKLTSVTIPDSVTSIGYSAFSECRSLTSITIPNSVTSIGDYAFRYCESLTSVTIPDSVTSIGYSAFSSCDSLTSITIPDSVTSIGGSAFEYCTSLTSIEIPDSVTSIGDHAFAWCDALISVIVGKKVEIIGYNAFRGCSNILEVVNNSSLDILAGSESHGYLAYYAKEVHNGNSKIVNKDGYSFYTLDGVNYLVNYVGNDTVLTLPESYNGENYEIYYHAFYNNHKITSVTIPNSVTSIGDSAFSYCYSLTSITIPESVTSIGDSAFYQCSRLVEVINKSSLNITKFSYDYGEVALFAMEVHNGNSKIVNKDGYLFYTALGTNYLVGYMGNDTDLILPENYNGENYKIYRLAFFLCEDAKSVVIPESVTSIGDYAFYYCTSLENINYCGSEEEWNAISKGIGWDNFKGPYITGSYTINYNCTK